MLENFPAPSKISHRLDQELRNSPEPMPILARVNQRLVAQTTQEFERQLRQNYIEMRELMAARVMPGILALNGIVIQREQERADGNMTNHLGKLKLTAELAINDLLQEFEISPEDYLAEIGNRVKIGLQRELQRKAILEEISQNISVVATRRDQIVEAKACFQANKVQISILLKSSKLFQSLDLDENS